MRIDFAKGAGLVPAIIQDADGGQILMLGYMNEEAYQRTIQARLVTFYSRSRQRLWTKGEESGNFLKVVEIKTDCDGDALLIQAQRRGPVCHSGSSSCFGEAYRADILSELEDVIRERSGSPKNESYTSGLFSQGIKRMAQKLGEEALELALEAAAEQADKQRVIEESADLLFHLLVLLAAQNISFREVAGELRKRRQSSRAVRAEDSAEM